MKKKLFKQLIKSMKKELENIGPNIIKNNNILTLFRSDLNVESSNLPIDELTYSSFLSENRTKIRLANVVVFIDNDGKTRTFKSRYSLIENDLTFKQLRKANILLTKECFPSSLNWSTEQWVLALVGELGELANLIKKRNRGEYINKKDIKYELADVQFYLDKLANKEEIDIDEALKEKYSIVAKRFNKDLKL